MVSFLENWDDVRKVEKTNRKLYSAQEIRDKLLEINPQVQENSKYTNPFLYDDVKKWYEELGK